MKNEIKVLCHSSIKINGEKTIYVDPFKIDHEYNDADYIFCTHTHYDHFSPEDIRKVMKNDTKLIITKDAEDDALKLVNTEKIYLIEPNKEYVVDGLKFKTTYAYNTNKKFHPKENAWVGYIINQNDEEIYIAGDTDNIDEIQNIKCDIALIPIGGTYTMTYVEAADLINKLDTKIVIPTHYGSIVGEKEDGVRFKKLVKNKEVILQI